MRRALRWLGRGVVLLLALGVLAVGAGVLYLGSERGEAFLRAQAEAAVAAGGGRLAADRVRVSLAGTVTLDGVQLSFGRQSALRARRARIAWSPLALLVGQVRIRTLALDGPEIRLVQRGGSWGLPESDDDAAPGPRIRIKRLRIDDGRIAIGLEDGDAPTRIVLRDVRADAGVTIGWLVTRVDVRELAVRVAGQPLPALALRGGVDLRESQRRIDAQVATAESTLAVALTFADDGELGLEAETPRLAASDIRRLVPAWTAKDDVTFSVTAAGPMEALDTKATVDVGTGIALRAVGTVDGTVWPPRATLDIAGSTYDAPRVGPVRAESLEIAAGGDDPTLVANGALAVAEGRIELENARVGRGRAGGVGLRTGFVLPDVAPWVGRTGAVRGTLDLDGSQLRVEVADATTTGLAAAGTITADLEARTARADLRVRAPDAPERGGTVQADVAMVGETWRADVAIDAGDPARGRLATTARLEPAGAAIVARVATLELAEPERPPWRLVEPTTLRWTDGTLTIEPLAVVRGTSRLAAAGRVRPGSADALDVTIVADPVNLADVPEHVPAGISDVEGRLDAKITLRGALAAPTITGDGTLIAPRAEVPNVGTVEDIRLVLRGSPAGVLTIESLTARAGKGEITGRGEIGLVGGADAPIRVDLALRRVPLARRPLYEGVVTGTVVVDGTAAAPIVTADLRVPRAVLQPRLLPAEGGHLGSDPTITVVGDPAAEAPPPSAVEALAAVEIHATVKVGKNVRIVRKDGNIRLAGTLAIDKAVGGPFVLTGPIELPEGWYEFRGRRFEIRSGTIRFTGRPEPDPELRVRARHRAPGYLIWVTIGGTASAPTLALTSEPSLSEADVLAVLLFGRPASQLRGDQQSTVGREVQSVALSYVAPALEESARDVLPIDRLEVSGEEVTVARYVTQDIFISLSQELTERGGQTVGMEYDLGPRTSIKLSTSSRGSSAIDFFWHRRY